MLGAGLASMGSGQSLVSAPSTDLLGNRRPNPAGQILIWVHMKTNWQSRLIQTPWQIYKAFQKQKCELAWSADTSNIDKYIIISSIYIEMIL